MELIETSTVKNYNYYGLWFMVIGSIRTPIIPTKNGSFPINPVVFCLSIVKSLVTFWVAFAPVGREQAAHSEP